MKTTIKTSINAIKTITFTTMYITKNFYRVSIVLLPILGIINSIIDTAVDVVSGNRPKNIFHAVLSKAKENILISAAVSLVVYPILGIIIAIMDLVSDKNSEDEA